MTCDHTDIAENIEVSWCLGNLDINCCPDDIQHINICKDCGYIKVVDYQLCDECCIGNNSIENWWTDAKTQWTSPIITINGDTKDFSIDSKYKRYIRNPIIPTPIPGINLSEVKFPQYTPSTLLNLIYPIGSIVCLMTDISPVVIFGGGIWNSITNGKSLFINNTPGSTLGFSNSATLTPSGTFSDKVLTAEQSPKLKYIQENASGAYSITSGNSEHNHGAAASNFTPNGWSTSYAWYFDHAKTWRAATTPYTAASGPNGSFYALTVTQTSDVSVINATQTATISHTHTFTLPASTGTAHSVCFSANSTTLDLTNHPKVNMNIWLRVG